MDKILPVAVVFVDAEFGRAGRDAPSGTGPLTTAGRQSLRSDERLP